MSGNISAIDSINAFSSLSGQVQPYEEQIYTRSEVKALISDAIYPLELQIDALSKKIARLEAYSKSTECDNERAIKIKKILDERGKNQTITFAEVRGILGVNKVLLSRAVNVLLNEYPGKYAILRSKLDRRTRLLAKIV